MILITGGAGFIGSNFVNYWCQHSDERVVVLDKLTYAGNLKNLANVSRQRMRFMQGDICDAQMLAELFELFQPRAVVHFAAESHVDRSIHAPNEFLNTNILGTFQLLEAARAFYSGLEDEQKQAFRFLHVSTDEVYGSLSETDAPFSETTPYAPNSPYSASKAASDHLVRAWHHTYGLPVLTTNCSNNYGAFQFPEKLIPLMILNALSGKELPVYGSGGQIRDWLYVEDHCTAICEVLARGRVGETYNIGGLSEMRNIDVVHAICDELDARKPKANGESYRTQIRFVDDRPGHDQRYAMNIEKIQRELNWQPKEQFASGLKKTIDWYLSNEAWIELVQSGAYRN